MKSLLLTAILLLSFTTIQAQSVDEIIKTDIRVTATSKQLKEGLNKLENKCKVSPAPNCNKGKAFALYLLANDYYAVANNLVGLDAELEAAAVTKAKNLFTEANQLLPAVDLKPSNKRLLLDDKIAYESSNQ